MSLSNDVLGAAVAVQDGVVRLILGTSVVEEFSELFGFLVASCRASIKELSSLRSLFVANHRVMFLDKFRKPVSIESAISVNIDLEELLLLGLLDSISINLVVQLMFSPMNGNQNKLEQQEPHWL